jgi:hypothetical protein
VLIVECVSQNNPTNPNNQNDEILILQVTQNPTPNISSVCFMLVTRVNEIWIHFFFGPFGAKGLIQFLHNHSLLSHRRAPEQAYAQSTPNIIHVCPSLTIHTLCLRLPLYRVFLFVSKQAPPHQQHVAQQLTIQAQSHKPEWCDRSAVRDLVQDTSESK